MHYAIWMVFIQWIWNLEFFSEAIKLISFKVVKGIQWIFVDLSNRLKHRWKMLSMLFSILKWIQSKNDEKQPSNDFPIAIHSLRIDGARKKNVLI